MAGKCFKLQVLGSEVSCCSTVKSETTMMEEDRLLPMVALSTNQKASTLFIATRMKAIISDWSIFEVYKQKKFPYLIGLTHPMVTAAVDKPSSLTDPSNGHGSGRQTQ